MAEDGVSFVAVVQRRDGRGKRLSIEVPRELRDVLRPLAEKKVPLQVTLKPLKGWEHMFNTSSRSQPSPGPQG